MIRIGETNQNDRKVKKQDQSKSLDSPGKHTATHSLNCEKEKVETERPTNVCITLKCDAFRLRFSICTPQQGVHPCRWDESVRGRNCNCPTGKAVGKLQGAAFPTELKESEGR